MDPLCRLPLELVLIVAEQAAWSCVRARTGWVATLCLVSRPVRSAVTPILYHLVCVRNSAHAASIVSCSTHNAPFEHTRAICFAMDVYRNELADSVLRAFASAFGNVREFTGEHALLDALLAYNTGAHLSSAYIADTTLHWTPSFINPRVARIVSSIPYLHVLLDYNNGWAAHNLLVLQPQWLIVDVLCDRDHEDGPLDEDAISDLLGVLLLVLRKASLRRMTLRCRSSPEENSRYILRRIAVWGKSQRDPRVWLDEAYVATYDADGNQLYDALDLDDAVAGKCLWETGCQLYVP